MSFVAQRPPQKITQCLKEEICICDGKVKRYCRNGDTVQWYFHRKQVEPASHICEEQRQKKKRKRNHKEGS